MTGPHKQAEPISGVPKYVSVQVRCQPQPSLVAGATEQVIRSYLRAGLKVPCPRLLHVQRNLAQELGVNPSNREGLELQNVDLLLTWEAASQSKLSLFRSSIPVHTHLFCTLRVLPAPISSSSLLSTSQTAYLPSLHSTLITTAKGQLVSQSYKHF